MKNLNVKIVLYCVFFFSFSNALSFSEETKEIGLLLYKAINLNDFAVMIRSVEMKKFLYGLLPQKHAISLLKNERTVNAYESQIRTRINNFQNSLERIGFKPFRIINASDYGWFDNVAEFIKKEGSLLYVESFTGNQLQLVVHRQLMDRLHVFLTLYDPEIDSRSVLVRSLIRLTGGIVDTGYIANGLGKVENAIFCVDLAVEIEFLIRKIIKINNELAADGVRNYEDIDSLLNALSKLAESFICYSEKLEVDLLALMKHKKKNIEFYNFLSNFNKCTKPTFQCLASL